MAPEMTVITGRYHHFLNSDLISHRNHRKYQYRYINIETLNQLSNNPVLSPNNILKSVKKVIPGRVNASTIGSILFMLYFNCDFLNRN
jgi:hypothetical protein